MKFPFLAHVSHGINFTEIIKWLIFVLHVCIDLDQTSHCHMVINLVNTI
jgi:hypothetical protein